MERYKKRRFSTLGGVASLVAILSLSTSCEGSERARLQMSPQALNPSEFCAKNNTSFENAVAMQIRVANDFLIYGKAVRSDEEYVFAFDKCTEKDFRAALRHAQSVLEVAQQNKSDAEKIENVNNTYEALQRVGIKAGKISTENLVKE